MWRARNLLYERLTRRPTRSFSKTQLAIFALLHFAIGTIAIADGCGSLYTTAFGKEEEATFLVVDVRWKGRGLDCYNHVFAELSPTQSYLGGHCLASEYPPGSRFHYRGRFSAFGFKEDVLQIESPRPALLPTTKGH
jgi:hypothetical protein